VKKSLILLLITCAFPIAAAHAQDAVTLDTAIQEITGYLETRLGANSVVAVLNIKSHSQALSGYIIGELVNTIITRGNLIPVDRVNLNLIQDELQFHLSGDVSDESAQAIGKILGAGTIISGEIIAMNNKMYRLEIKAIYVETAAIQGTVNKNILVDKKIKAIINSGEGFPVSIGGGIHIGGSLTTGIRKEEGKQSDGGLMRKFTITETNSKSALDIGGFVFFDLKYAEINVSTFYGSGKSRESWSKDFSNNVLPSEKKDIASGSFSAMLLNIGVLGKYPFYMNKITLFPALGIDYQLWLLHSENGKRTSGDLSANNAIWLKLGGGIDYLITRSFFLRGELLWAAKLPSKNELDDSYTWFTHSPTFRIAIGFVIGR